MGVHRKVEKGEAEQDSTDEESGLDLGLTQPAASPETTKSPEARRERCLPEPQRSFLFPFRIFPSDSVVVDLFVPKTWQVIQDWTHLVVISGLFGSLALLVGSVLAILDYDTFCSRYCGTEMLAIGAVLPTLAYISKIVASYDEQIQVKTQRVALNKEALWESYSGLLASCEALLSKAAESSATMAERSFESKRRDFMRFVDRVAGRYGQQLEVASEEERRMLLEQFCRFISCWLSIFKECSVDPVQNPRLLLSPEELRRCRTFQEVATLTVDRLRSSEVAFIRAQQAEDAKAVCYLRASAEQRASLPASPLATSRPAAAARGAGEIELSDISRPLNEESVADAETGYASGTIGGVPLRDGGLLSSLASHLAAQKWFGWLRVQAAEDGKPFSLSGGESFPQVCQVLSLQVVLLSADHALLLLGFCLGLATLVAQARPFNSDADIGLGTKANEALWMLPVWAYVVCIFVLLARFEELDVIRRLELEVARLQEESARVAKRREEMVAFWKDMQALTDLWLQRTLPRLELLKEVHGHLEATPSLEVAVHMAAANDSLEALEARLPALERCRQPSEAASDGLVAASSGAASIAGGFHSAAIAEAFGEGLTSLCREEEELPNLLRRLQDFVKACPAVAGKVDDCPGLRHHADDGGEAREIALAAVY
eukprot:TRINITY_DN50368_c0_g1_i1.p1 TRINITY_DN50368_c0_g1~~TRINITY_DN50368_c0_g1_i1.p1  ORF type:complete len:661 (-),score=186.56 TRINITY_DN50368_c0_g1_i1:127-2109(-)